MEKRNYTVQSRALRHARSESRALSARRGGSYLINPPVLHEKEITHKLTKVGTLTNDKNYSHQWTFLDYSEDGQGLDSQTLLDFIEIKTNGAGQRWLEVKFGGLANINESGTMFMPMSQACHRRREPYPLVFTAGSNRNIEYTSQHIGLPDKGMDIRTVINWVPLKPKEYTPEALFFDLLAEINTVAKDGLEVQAARARGLQVVKDGDIHTFSVDGYIANLSADGQWSTG